MKLKIFILSLFLSVFTTALIAQNNSDDQELSSALNDLNTFAKSKLKEFKKDLCNDFKISEEKIDKLMTTFGMQPADVFMTLQVSKQSGKTVEDVAENFKKNKDKGWGVIAKEMGIKPGSKEFHALKDSAKGKSKKMKEEKGNKDNGKGKNGDNKGKGNGKKK